MSPDPLAGLAPDEKDLVRADAARLWEVMSTYHPEKPGWETLPPFMRAVVLRLARNPYYIEDGAGR